VAGWSQWRAASHFQGGAAIRRRRRANLETLGWDSNGHGVLESDERLRIEYDPEAEALGQVVGDYFVF